ncbi:EthD family reductase [Burkholderia sp. PAMC 26561]|uniref:EthD family reductase n=1 Tax=Burkholderia sp. PAMC 26561 TaxID=1795043 RepID=UPI00076B2299|nr:EthD family reductase [Burkholderia sp. PAMC 26561]AME27385.1 ethyl tert-butyl ether degradation protein EthD [Burkholderia sp. PAMC 26561]AME27998.1 ethyl tert-butyl ether degradation protein EthD [Burkholderia sp. PAMC 26561]
MEKIATGATHDDPTVTFYVIYTGGPDARFDRNWYVDHHLPLVMKSWSKYGLESVAALFRSGEQNGTQVICECNFRDMAAVHAAFDSPEAAAVMADVIHFTELMPQRLRVVPI